MNPIAAWAIATTIVAVLCGIALGWARWPRTMGYSILAVVVLGLIVGLASELMRMALR